VIAEFAHHQSWIAWVPIVAPLLAIVGALLGLAIGAIVVLFDRSTPERRGLEAFAPSGMRGP
jgi:NhaP-type Na+/H+ or K+/H+ antiporter